jgi:hypothetical protein
VFNPKLHVKSEWYPPAELLNKTILLCLLQFRRSLSKLLVKRPTRSNLLPHQSACLRALQESHTLMVARTDKNLGPAVIDRLVYIQ